MNNHDHGTAVRTTSREARRLSALVSATRNFEATDKRGVYFMPATDEVQALRDADFLTTYGVTVLATS